MSRPYRFSIQGGPFEDPNALAAHAREVSSLGYDELFSADHVGENTIDPFIPLVTAAHAAPTLSVGTLVLNNEFHHPAMLARTAIAVDRVTSGRLVLGLGTGYAQSEHDAIGMTLRPPGERVDRFAESLSIVRELLDTGACHFEGDHHCVHIDDIGHRAAQDSVPLLVGGHGRRVVGLAARFADIYQFTGLIHGPDGKPGTGGFSMEHLVQRAAWLTEVAGDRNDVIERSALVQVTAVGEDVPSTDDLATRFGVPVEVAAETPFALVGTVDEVVAKIVRLREQLGITHYVVRDAAGFAPVVDALREFNTSS